MIVTAMVSGVVMALGLIISGMINPQKVLGFLDVFGHFDPTLIVVMMGALAVAGIGFRFFKRSKPFLATDFDVPQKTKLDAPLLIGAALFGIGWGLAGFCPGPAIVGIGFGFTKIYIFVASMVVGMLVARRVLKTNRSNNG